MSLNSPARRIHITADVTCDHEFLSSALSEKTSRGTMIDFQGEEPFTSFDRIKELCEWVWNQNFPESFTFFATSDGTLIHGRIQEWLSLHKKQFKVGLNLVGTALDAIDLDFFLKTWPSQGVGMTISPSTISSLAEDIIFLHDKGFRDISASLAQKTDWSDDSLQSMYGEQLSALADYYALNPLVEKCSLFKIPFSALKEPDTDACNLLSESVCGECAFFPICLTCHGSDYIERNAVESRNMGICEMEKIRFSIVARYEHDRIVNDPRSLDDIPLKERYKQLRTLNGIVNVMPILKLT